MQHIALLCFEPKRAEACAPPVMSESALLKALLKASLLLAHRLPPHLPHAAAQQKVCFFQTAVTPQPPGAVASSSQALLSVVHSKAAAHSKTTVGTPQPST